MANSKQKPNQQNVYLHEDHGKPTTRREFLATGLLGFSGWMFAPSILGTILTPSNAEAASCGVQSANVLPPFMTVNLSGGPGMPGYIVPMDQSGQMVSSYNAVGLGDKPGFVSVFANKVPVPVYGGSTTYIDGKTTSPASATNLPTTGVTAPSPSLPAGAVDPNTPFVSQFFQGLLLQINADIQLKTSMVSVMIRSQDDSSANTLDISGLIQAAGYSGTILPSLGNVNSASGVSQAPAIMKPTAPSIINSYSDVTNAISLHANVRTQLKNDPKLQQSLLKLVKNLSSSQATRMVSSVGADSAKTLGQLVTCATDKNFNLSSDSTIISSLDPKNDANMTTIWQLTNTATLSSLTQTQRIAQGAMVYNLLKGNSSTIGINLGGNDYHGNPRSATDVTDFRNGVLVGKALASAHALQKPLFIYITADGATGSTVSSQVSDWSGDRGTGGAAFLIAYHPTQAPTTTGNQLGYFTQAQAADDKFIVGGDTARAATAIFRNYLEFAYAGKGGGQAVFDKLFLPGTSSSFDSNQLKDILKFAA